MGFNKGMCKWSQYINALSDVTGCDPGSIIAIAGQLGFKACGVDIYNEGGEGRYTPTQIGRGYECKANFNPLLDKLNEQTGQVHGVPLTNETRSR